MKSSRGNARSYTSRIEQIIAEFFTKALQIILESRCSDMSSPSSFSSSRSSSFETRDKWFNLALKEYPQALDHIDSFKQEPSALISPWFISDYVGKQLAERIKRFSSFPVSHGSQPSMYLDSPPVKFKGTSKSIDLNELCSSPVCFPILFPSLSMCVARMDASKALLRHGSAPASTSPSKVFNKKTSPTSSESHSEDFIDASASFLDKMSFCRRSHRFQIGDDFDNTVFSCPFAGDDDNMADSVSRSESDNQAEGLGFLPVSQSEDATIGALILMLKQAPPLAHLNLECQQSEKRISSNAVSSKTLTDGLEELRAFVRIKEMLISRRTERSRLNLVKTLV